ncbi:UNVERIFIED_CONTAM: hypothetical protein ABIC26_001634 [Paenibacillus sp. PvR008]
MTVTTGKLHDSQEFFHKYGIQAESPHPWEDGMRLSKELKPGQWEWWYTDGSFFAWFCAVPSGKFTGTITVEGHTQEVEGSGYHDHNWGMRN